MSVIVGVTKEKEISIASDTQSSRGSLKILDGYKAQDSKIYKIDNTLLGITGWHAIEQIFEHILKNKPKIFDFTSRIKIFESLLQIQDILEEEYFIETREKDDQPVSSNQLTAIVVNKHGLFDIDSYREVSQFSKFWAIGSGQEYALGAMHALYDKEYKANEIAKAGIKSACDFDDGCSLPFKIETMKI
jgi:ATP-dependent protease HslVU (ClpYQ) peptidase subunit